MNPKPTVPEHFLTRYYWPTVRELIDTGKTKEAVFDIAIERFEQTERFTPGIAFRSLYRHIKAERLKNASVLPKNTP